jgi:TonB family protein
MKPLPFWRRLTSLKVFVVCFACSPTAYSQSAPQPEIGPPPLVNSVETWDMTVDSLRKMLWEAEQMPAPVKDVAGRTLADYLSEFVLPPASVKRLTELRENARTQQADAEAVKRIIAEAQPLIVMELYKTFAITTYWAAREVIAYHEKILAPWLSFADEADRQAVNTHFKATEVSLAKTMLGALLLTDNAERDAAVVRLSQMRSRASAFYNERRLSFVQLASGKPGAPPLQTRQRESACTTRPAGTSGKSVPALAPDNEAPESVYPAFAKHANVEGPVVVNAHINSAGCMESAEVAQSSGDETLDAAALQWTERGNFLPAVKDGTPVAGTLRFRLKFELRD